MLHYFRLSFFPTPLVIDYADWPLVTHLREALLPLIAVGVGVALTLWAVRARPALGFAGAWIWLILAPTSSVIPIADVAFEHRMYLPLAAVITLAVLGVDALLKRAGTWPNRLRVRAGLLGLTGALLAAMTMARNQDYRSELAMWTDVTRKRPLNARAFNNLGVALAQQRKLGAAITCYDHAIRLDPRNADAHYNLATAQFRQERFEEATMHYVEAVRLNPADVQTRNDLGVALSRTGHVEEATTQFVEAIALKPAFADAYNNLGNALLRQGKRADALVWYRQALRLDPQHRHAFENLQRATSHPSDE